MKLGKNGVQDKIEIIINLMKSIFLVTNNTVGVMCWASLNDFEVLRPQQVSMVIRFSS